MKKFKATDEQVKQMAANAVNASVPMGAGFIHYNPDKKFTPEDFPITKHDDISLDYVQGRMVKLRMIRSKNVDDVWVINPNISLDYQSWANTYDTVDDLITSVGAEVVQ